MLLHTFSLSVLAFSTTVAAQGQVADDSHRITANGVPIFASLALDSGELTVHDAPPASYQDSEVCYDNSVDVDPFFPVFDALLYPAGDELFDWGVKFCVGSNFVDRLTVGYSSAAAVGNNGSLTLRVYAGATGFGNFGTQVAEVTLDNIPSSGNVLSVSPVILEVELGSQSFFLPEGQIGWSYTNPDGLTAPLLVDVRIETGTQNFFDVYSPGPAPTGSFAGTFVLPPGGASGDPLENSFYIVVNENDVVAQTAPLAAGANPAILSTPDVPILGSPWRAVLDISSFPSASTSFLAVSAAQLPGGAGSPFGTLVIDPLALVTKVQVRPAGTDHVLNFPTDSALVGRQLYTQVLFDSNLGLLLTNGLELTLGTF